MSTGQSVLLGVVALVLALMVLACAVCRARTVLDEAELRTGVRHCRFSGGRGRDARPAPHLWVVDPADEQIDRDERCCVTAGREARG